VEYDEGRRAQLLQAARAHAVGTAKDLSDYFRMPVGDARLRLRELVESGELHEARVEGWRGDCVSPPEGGGAAKH
jgi:uncharacterized protein